MTLLTPDNRGQTSQLRARFSSALQGQLQYSIIFVKKEEEETRQLSS